MTEAYSGASAGMVAQLLNMIPQRVFSWAPCSILNDASVAARVASEAGDRLHGSVLIELREGEVDTIDRGADRAFGRIRFRSR